MCRYNSENSVVIIGAGLVGSAILNELALRWVRVSQGIETIHITARSESKLIAQLQKTKDWLERETNVSVEAYNPLQLRIGQGNRSLQITADRLDILPENLTTATVDSEAFRKTSSLYTYLVSKRPKTLIIGVNLAGMVAYTQESGDMQNLVLAWILTTLKQAVDELGTQAVAIIGTTALGGQGTNMVWTHQSSQQMDANLVKKILAAYGILGILDRIHYDTDSTARWILLTPGSLLGYDYLGFGTVKYFSAPQGLPEEVEQIVIDSGLNIPLYSPLAVNLASLCDEMIHWEERRISAAFLSGAQIKCGESGIYSPLQFACLSHVLQMGFNTNTYIARILIEELIGKPTGYNQIPLGAGKVIEPTAQGQNERDLTLWRLAALEREQGIRSPPVYPALGSTRTQKEIVLADLLYRLLKDHFEKPTLQQITEYDPKVLAEELWNDLQAHPRLFAEIAAVIPIISPDGQIYTGPYMMYLNKGITRTSDLAILTDKARFRDFAALGAVDLRPELDQIIRGSKVYKTGIAVLIERAQLLDKRIKALPLAEMDRYGSNVDPQIRYWQMLTADSQTMFDPVLFVVQFLGGERPFVSPHAG